MAEPWSKEWREEMRRELEIMQSEMQKLFENTLQRFDNVIDGKNNSRAVEIDSSKDQALEIEESLDDGEADDLLESGCFDKTPNFDEKINHNEVDKIVNQEVGAVETDSDDAEQDSMVEIKELKKNNDEEAINHIGKLDNAQPFTYYTKLEYHEYSCGTYYDPDFMGISKWMLLKDDYVLGTFVRNLNVDSSKTVRERVVSTLLPVLPYLHVLTEGTDGLSYESRRGKFDPVIGVFDPGGGRNAAVYMATELCMLPWARQVFDEMRIRNVPTWNAFIVGYSRSGKGTTRIREEVGLRFRDLLGIGKSGIIASIIAACQRLQIPKYQYCQALAATVGSKTETSKFIVPRILFLEGYFLCEDKSNWNWARGAMVARGYLDVGENEVDTERMLLGWERECLEAYRWEVEKAVNAKARLHQSVAAKEVEFPTLMAAFGELNIHLPIQTGKRMTSLKEKLAYVTPLLEDPRMKKEERIKQIADIKTQIEKISGEISGYNYPNDTMIRCLSLEEQDLSLRRLTEFQTQLQTLQKKKSDRFFKVLKYINELHLLCGVLGLALAQTITDVHPRLQRTNQEQTTNSSNDTFEGLEQTFNKLQIERKIRIQKLRNIVAALLELWNLMDSLQTENNIFSRATYVLRLFEAEVTEPGVLSEMIEQASAEVERLTKLKANTMEELVMKRISELEDICSMTYIEPDASTVVEKFNSLIDYGLVDPFELLANSEAQITKAKGDALSREEIMGRIDRWPSACEERNFDKKDWYYAGSQYKTHADSGVAAREKNVDQNVKLNRKWKDQNEDDGEKVIGTWTFIFGVGCASTMFIPSFHSYRIWSFLDRRMIKRGNYAVTEVLAQRSSSSPTGSTWEAGLIFSRSIPTFILEDKDVLQEGSIDTCLIYFYGLMH